MSSLGIFNKETKTYQKVAGTAEAAVLDTAMSDTSENPVQNKVIKKYVDEKQVEVPIAGTGKAGIVKPADGLTVAEDGTLKVKLDGTTLTMDQVNNVIKLADTLKEKINGALPAANVVNNLTTTEAGFALDARQANPNIDGSLAKQISDLNGSLLKFQRFTVTTTEIAVNSDSYIQLLYPQSYKELIALIPMFIRPRSHWDSIGTFWDFDGSKINFRVIGSESASAQTFDVEYYWVYR